MSSAPSRLLRSWLDRLAGELFPFDQPSTRAELWAFRAIELLICWLTVYTVWRWVPGIENIETVVLPLGIAKYVDITVLFRPGTARVVAALLTLMLVGGFVARLRYTYLVALLLFHVMYVARYSLGEISHGSHFPGIAVLALGLGTALFRENEHALHRFVIGFTCFFFGIGYMSAGVCKLVATGIDWPSADHMYLWLDERRIDMLSTHGEFHENAVRRFLKQHHLLGTLTLASGLASELSALLLWFRRTRPYSALALILMHLGIEVTLDVYFGHNIYLLAAVGFPWRSEEAHV